MWMLPFRTKSYSTMQLFLSDLASHNYEHCRAEKHCNRTGTGSCYIHPGRIMNEVQIFLMACYPLPIKLPLGNTRIF